jgi:hypothetical protein
MRKPPPNVLELPLMWFSGRFQWYIEAHKAKEMREAFRLFIVIGQAALIVTAACFAPALAIIKFKFAPTSIEEVILGAMMVVIPAGIAGWWIFRKLKAHHPRREARAAAIACAVLTPATLAMGLVLGPVFGGYAGVLFGDRLAFLSAVTGVIVILTIMNFALVSFTLWIMGIDSSLQ